MVMLMQEIVSGSVSLYSRTIIKRDGATTIMNRSNGVADPYIYNAGTDWTEFWLSKPGQAAVRISDENIFDTLKKQLLRYFAGYPYVVDEISSSSIEIEDIKEIVFDYNFECAF